MRCLLLVACCLLLCVTRTTLTSLPRCYLFQLQHEVFKYLDNITNVYKNATTMMITMVLSAIYLDFHPTLTFVCGFMICCTSLLLYNGAYPLHLQPPRFCRALLPPPFSPLALALRAPSFYLSDAAPTSSLVFLFLPLK